MDQNGLLLERYSGRPPGRLHEGQIITVRPNLCRTFDAFEIPRSHCASFQIAPRSSGSAECLAAGGRE